MSQVHSITVVLLDERELGFSGNAPSFSTLSSQSDGSGSLAFEQSEELLQHDLCSR